MLHPIQIEMKLRVKMQKKTICQKMENQTIQGRNFLMQNGQHGLSRCSREP
jgi:hypothetical protein